MAAAFDVEHLKAIILAAFPELSHGNFSLLTAGWDSVAVNVDGHLVFKFPRHADAESGLRREAMILEIVAPAVGMPVPRLSLVEQPTLFSRHEKIPGEHLLSMHYPALTEQQRQALGETMAQFYAELHTIPVEKFRAAGGLEMEPWLDPDEILRRCRPVLSETQFAYATSTLAAWAELPPDPYGEIFGYFDGHGWNMAFDHARGALNGLYDFADSAFGPLHQEFLYSNMISPDLTRRIVDHYEIVSGKSLDRERVALITGVHRLWELAMEAHDDEALPIMLRSLQNWIDVENAEFVTGQ